MGGNTWETRISASDRPWISWKGRVTHIHCSRLSCAYSFQSCRPVFVQSMKDPVRSRSHLVALGASKRATVNGHNQSVGKQLDDHSVGSGGNGSVCIFNREIYGQRIDFGRDCNAHLFSGHNPRVDPRPVGEKAFTNLCARQLISYLSTHGFSSSLSPKAMISPTTKEFASLASFLFRVLDENFKLGSKSEEDITTVFKQLRYPFQISKSSLYAVGSAHTWPYLLAALIWLVHVYIYEDEVKKVVSSSTRVLPFLASKLFGQIYRNSPRDATVIFSTTRTEPMRYVIALRFLDNTCFC